MSYTVEARGSQYDLSYRLFFKNAEGQYISPWHDIPLYPNEADKSVINMVVEIPRWTNFKSEVNKAEPLNPIAHDVKNGKVRAVHSFFPHHGYIFNYGAAPRTYENPDLVDKHTNAKGDDDPLDVCDVSDCQSFPGEVKQIKVLGLLAMIDEGETDWKIIGIDVRDPEAAQVNDIDDLDKIKPGMLAAINEWFRCYKIPAGKGENTFAFNGEAKNKEFTMGIIEETHDQWKKLMADEGDRPKISRNSTVLDGKGKISAEDAAAIVAKAPEAAPAKAVDPAVHKWHFIRL